MLLWVSNKVKAAQNALFKVVRILSEIEVSYVDTYTFTNSKAFEYIILERNVKIMAAYKYSFSLVGFVAKVCIFLVYAVGADIDMIFNTAFEILALFLFFTAPSTLNERLVFG